MRRRTPVAAGGEDKLAEPGALALENVFFYLRKKIDTGQCFVKLICIFFVA